MRGLIWIPSLTACWFGLGACFYVHDDDCSSNLDCHSGRVCQQGECVDAEAAEGSSDGSGGGEGTGPALNSSTTGSSDGSGGGEGTGPAPNSSTTGSGAAAPGCGGIQSGTQIVAVTSGPSVCMPAHQAFSAVFGAGSMLESVELGQCSLTEPGTECYEAFPDTYECGSCSFEVYLSSIFSEGESVNVGWVITPASCSAGCAYYCCTSEGTDYPGLYWLSQTPPGG